MRQADRGATERKSGSRVAFFGGSFDPPHCGHLAVARAAREAFRLDTVLFAPVGAQPLKPEGSAASFEDRLAMTRLAIEGETGFAVSLADAPKTSVERGETGRAPNYSIDTLERLRAESGDDGALFCLMGADSSLGLRHWHRAAELPFVAPLIVASRPGQRLDSLQEALPDGLTLEPASEAHRKDSGVEVRAFFVVNRSGRRAPFYLLPDVNVEISATEIREWIRSSSLGRQHGAQAGAAEKKLLPEAVAEYIQSHGLYR